jgi:hypothetical protein
VVGGHVRRLPRGLDRSGLRPGDNSWDSSSAPLPTPRHFPAVGRPERDHVRHRWPQRTVRWTRSRRTTRRRTRGDSGSAAAARTYGVGRGRERQVSTSSAVSTPEATSPRSLPTIRAATSGRRSSRFPRPAGTGDRRGRRVLYAMAATATNRRDSGGLQSP